MSLRRSNHTKGAGFFAAFFLAEVVAHLLPASEGGGLSNLAVTMALTILFLLVFHCLQLLRRSRQPLGKPEE